MIYYGKTARDLLQKNLDDRNYNKCRGYFIDDNTWVAFDNTSGNCWVEEFKNEETAICWLEQFFEMSQLNEFEVFKLEKNLFFIPNSGFIKIQFVENSITSKFHPFLGKG